MAILLMIFRKMLNNRWLVGSLLLGLLITVALVSSIPSYTSGVLQRLLVEELEDYQLKYNEFPGTMYQYVNFNASEEDEAPDGDKFRELEHYFQHDLSERVGLPVRDTLTILNTGQLKMEPQDTERYDPRTVGDRTRITALNGIEDHITITDGKLPAAEPINGVYEAIVPENALVKQNMVLDMVFTVQPPKEASGDSLRVKPVGTFKAKDERDPYWFSSVGSYSEHFIMADTLFRQTFVEGGRPWLSSAQLFSFYDYHAIQLRDIERLLGVPGTLQRHSRAVLDEIPFSIKFPIQHTLKEYLIKEKQLRLLLWTLNVPVLILLAFYLFMVSRLIVDRQQTEIAVLRSRGASKKQVVLIFVLEIVILGLLAFFVGPWIGLMLSRILGASNGFLEFVQRTALPVHLTLESYTYALWAVLACVIMILIPVLLATRETIVSQKKQTSRHMGMAVWHKFFIDIALLLVAWYGWSNYERQLQKLVALPEELKLSIDPLLFFIPAVFVLGMGLFCLRLYPLLVRLIHWAGHRFWTPPMYTTLVQVGRSSKQYQFLMLFLVITIAVGIFSASTARTINNNMEEQLYYANGADVNLKVRWEDNAPSPPSPGGQGMGEMEAEEEPLTEEDLEELAAQGPNRTQYAEPPFQPFTQLSGVAHAAQVFRKDKVRVEGEGDKTGVTTLMAISPKDFGLTAWFKPQLLPHHWYAYLNLMAQEPSSILVSRSLASRLGLRAGDYVNAKWGNSDASEFVVYGVVDYWPSWSPKVGESEDKDGSEPMLMVANLSYVQNTMGLEPYEVWLKLKPDASTERFYQAVGEEGLPITTLNNARQQVIEMKNSASMLGLNGALTLGFLISMIVTFIGFLLYWVLTLRSRVLQYGIFRAMGMSFRQLVGMMAWEQLLTSGMACLIGIVVGGLTSRLFVPLFQLPFGEMSDAPPFQVVVHASDEIRLYIFVATMLLIGLSVLGWLLSRIRIHQAVKLGED